MKSDAILTVDTTSNLYDISLDANGDIAHDDFFDTSILYSLFGEKRAAPDEVVEPQLRRGWIGNSDTFENGSKIWLLMQARLTRDVMNRLEDEAKKSLQWLVEDGLAVAVTDANVTVSTGRVLLTITIQRTRDKIDRKFFTLWENTGNAS